MIIFLDCIFNVNINSKYIIVCNVDDMYFTDCNYVHNLYSTIIMRIVCIPRF